MQLIRSCTIDGENVKIKVKLTLQQATKAQTGVEVQLYSFLNLDARCGGWSTPHPGRFTHGKYQVPVVQETHWAPGPVWKGAENLDPSGI